MTCPACPKCGGATVTDRSGTTTGEWRRACLSCHATFYTVEVYDWQAPGAELKRHLDRILERGERMLK